MGDPELQVYRGKLPTIRIILDRSSATVTVKPLPLPGASTEKDTTASLEGALVHISAGDRELNLRADAAGTVSLPPEFAAADKLEVTVSHPDYLTGHQVIEQPPTAGHTRCRWLNMLRCCRRRWRSAPLINR